MNDKAAWEAAILVLRPLPRPLLYAYGPQQVTRIRAHRLVADQLVASLMACLDAGVPLSRLVYGGCYVWRAKRGNPRQLSTHTWGIAVDLDPANNPMGRRWRNHGAMLDERIVTTFLAHGWTWGDSFNDPQHFQCCSGY